MSFIEFKKGEKYAPKNARLSENHEDFSDCGYVLEDHILVVDIDIDEKTNTILSKESLKALLKINDVNTKIVHTTRGFHLYFKRPENLNGKGGIGALSGFPVELEYKHSKNTPNGVTIKQNGELRTIENPDVLQELPDCLFDKSAVYEVKPPAELEPFDGTFDFDLFKDCVRQLNNNGHFDVGGNYYPWSSFVNAVARMVVEGRITKEQGMEIMTIIDDGTGSSFDKFNRALTEPEIQYGHIVNVMKDNGIMEIFDVCVDNNYQRPEFIPTGYVIDGGKLLKPVTVEVKDYDEDGRSVTRIENKQIIITVTAPKVMKKLSDIETDDVFFQLSWYENGRNKTLTVSGETISTKKGILSLASKGFRVDENTAKDVMSFISSYLNYNEIDEDVQVSRLGHVKGGYFIHPLASHGISIEPRDNGEKKLFNAFQVKGTVESWKENVLSLVKDCPNVLTAVGASLASILLKDIGVKPFTVDIHGHTSSAKSTTQLVASTVYGSSDLILSWNTTRVGVECSLGFLNSFPLIIDDTQKQPVKKIIPDIVYQVSEGQGKGRGAKSGGMRDSATWEGLVISSGENSLDKFGDAGGLKPRTLPVTGQFVPEDFDFTALYEAMSEHFGAVGLEWVQTWTERKHEHVKGFKDVEKRLVDKATNSVAKRVARNFASVVFALMVANQELSLGLSEDELNALDTVFEAVNENSLEVDKPKSKMNDVLSYLDANRHLININDGVHLIDDMSAPIAYVRRLGKDGQIVMLIPPTKVNELLGNTDSAQIRSEWMRKGLTMTHVDKGKETDVCKKKISHTSVPRFIWIPESTMSELGFNFTTTAEDE